MNLPDGLLPTTWIWLGHLLYWPVFVWALRGAPWWHLKDSQSLHVLLGTTVGVMLLWVMKAGFAEGLTLHLLGATLLTLMFGWHFALIALALVLLGVTLQAGDGYAAFAVNALMLGVLPVAVSHGLFRLIDRRLPNNFFVYVFLCAFLGGAVTISSVGIATTGLLRLSGAYPLDFIIHNYSAYYMLLVFPEAFITGMLMTVFVLYRPEWVATFDDARYLRSR